MNEFHKLGRALESALDNYQTRIPKPAVGVNLDALSDIEVDVEAALKAVRFLIKHELAVRNAIAQRDAVGD
jgi:hypothetical protein